jgi:hypothetical protein
MEVLMSLVRPKLNEIPLVDTFPLSRGSCSITIDIGGWDNLIEAAYNNGFFLIEMDENENPVRVFHKVMNNPSYT